MLERQQEGKYFSVAAPEVSVLKTVAIIRTPNLDLNLANPKIIKTSGKAISFSEPCCSLPGMSFNCLRFVDISIENGLDKKVIQLSGLESFLVQHEMDHFNGVFPFNRLIKMVVVREGGSIKLNDICPCGSKKRFKECCLFKP